MPDFALIANDAIIELKNYKNDTLRFSAPTFLSITDEGTIRSSNLLLTLNNADIAAIILPYSYVVLKAEDSSAFILFIDKNGYCSDSITINGWTLKFDSPKETLYRTYHRDAIISKDGQEIALRVSGNKINTNDFKRIWKFFNFISEKGVDFITLQLLEDLYYKEIEIDNLRTDNIRKEYELITINAHLKANQELIENLKQIINSK